MSGNTSNPTEITVTTGRTPADGENPSVDHPAHYNQHPSGVECIDIVRWMGFNLGNVVKYLWRDGLKDAEVELQDLEKAAWYLTNEIERRKSGTEEVLGYVVRYESMPYKRIEDIDLTCHPGGSEIITIRKGNSV